MPRFYANFRVATKLGLAAFSFAFPLAFIIWALVAEQNIAIRFASQEAIGASYLTGLAAVQGHAAAISLAGEKAGSGTAALADTVAGLEKDFGATMETAAQEAAVIAAWQKPGGLDDGRSKLRDLIARIGDRSNLILDNVLDTYYLTDVVLNRLPDILDRLADLAHQTGTTASPEARAQFLVGLGTLVGDIDGMDGSMASAEQAEGGADIRTAHDTAYRKLHADLETMVDAMKASKTDDVAVNAMLGQSTAFSEAAAHELGALLKIRVQSLHATQIRTLALTALLFAAASAAMMLAVRVGVTRPLDRLRAATTRLAQGDLDSLLPARTTDDELGDLLQALHDFQDQGQQKRRLEGEATEARLRREHQQEAMRRHSDDFGVSVSAVLGTLGASAGAMRHAAADMAQAVEQTRATSVSTAEGAAESSRNLVAVAAATEQLTGSVDEIARQVREAAELAREGVTRAQATDQTVRGLSDAAAQIDGVTRLIFDIASKTNLLALNATIEAARAGDAGKGFAVVAAEVKLLAAQTANATQQISTQIQTIQGGTAEAVKAVHEMAEAILQMDKVASSIAGRVDDQGNATREIASSVQAVARQNDGAVGQMEHVAAIVEKSVGVSSLVLSTADEVAKVSKTLRQEVDHYLTALRMENDSDRRTWVRVPGGNQKLTLKQADGTKFAAQLADISRGGASLTCTTIRTPGTELNLELPTGASVPCRVVRASGGNMGIIFIQSPAATVQIDAAMAACSTFQHGLAAAA